MVISVRTPDGYATSQVSQEFEVAIEPRRTAPVEAPRTNGDCYCPRCETRLMMGYDEPQCLNCGFANYDYTQESTPRNQINILSTATRYILRYVGDFPSLSESLAHVKLIRIRNRVIYAVACPFCDKSMDQSSLSGKRPEVREQRYRCMDGHRVSLVPGKNGMLGWR
jgi:hypothetical protein